MFPIPQIITSKVQKTKMRREEEKMRFFIEQIVFWKGVLADLTGGKLKEALIVVSELRFSPPSLVPPRRSTLHFNNVRHC